MLYVFLSCTKVYLLKSFRDIDIVFSKDLLKYFYKRNYKIIPNGIKTEEFSLSLEKNSEFTFIAVGRLQSMKNHKLLIEIANKLNDKYDFVINIVGEGPLRSELESLIEKYKLEGKVNLLGLRNDIPQLLNKSHCLLMPSIWEGLPLVILEAGASSLPVISTPVGSIPSLLNEKNSYLSELDQFQKNMVAVMTNYDKVLKKGMILFKNISENYSINKVINEHELLYKNVFKMTKKSKELKTE